MCRAILNVGLLLLAVFSHAAEPPYPQEITKWEEVAIPPEKDRGARMVWLYSANYSKHAWRVFVEDGQPRAQLLTEAPKKHPDKPKFTPKAENFRRVSAHAPVDDGWLVGFNHGEFGAALYWFSSDGKRSYKISDHQIVDFFSLSDGICAIEGLAHMGMSRGSVIRIARSHDNARWQASSVVELPFAPCAVSVRRNASLLITLSDSLESVGVDRKIQTLLPDAPWRGLDPNSSVLLENEEKVYIGMRQFVGEFDLTTKKLRLLIPSKQFLHKLPEEDAEQIRKQYAN